MPPGLVELAAKPLDEVMKGTYGTDYVFQKDGVDLILENRELSKLKSTYVDALPQLVEELFPLDISQLFFFDAEKIRSLARDFSSSRRAPPKAASKP